MTPESAASARSPRLVLVGAGHAHLFVLEGLALGRLGAALQTALVAPAAGHVYSGMVPGLLAGRYRPEELTFDLASLARRAGAELVTGVASGIDPAGRLVELSDGRRLPYDVVSFAIGGVPAGRDLPGVGELALLVKPIETALSLGPALDRLVRGRADAALQVAVVGAGLAGVEIALGIRERLRRGGQAEAQIVLVDRETRVAHDRAAACGREILAALSRGRIDLQLGNAVTQVQPGGLRLAGGETLRADLVVWAAGAASPPLFRRSGLATDPDGFLLVDDALRSVSHPEVFGSGDAVTLRDHPGTRRTGVHAVRQAPILRDNLGRALARAAPEHHRRYHPPRHTLALVNTGDGAAVLSYGGIAVTGQWAMSLKDRIDRRFMNRFSAPGRGA